VTRAARNRSADETVIADDVSSGPVADREPPAGVELTYAVRTLREGKPAEKVATATVGPVLREIRDPVLIADPDGVRGAWTAPPGARGIQVTRTGGSSRRTLAQVTDHGFTDPDAQVAVTYEYLVQVRYRPTDGPSSTSPGVVLTGGREPAPVPVDDLQVEVGDDGDLDLRWTPPPVTGATVLLHLSPERPKLPAGVTPKEKIQNLSLMPVTGNGRPGSGQVAAPGRPAVYWLTPITVLGGFAAAGRSLKVERALPPVRNLRAELLGDQVRLRWEWVGATEEVWVLWRQEHRPESVDDRAAQRQLVSRPGYDQNGVRVDGLAGDYWFAVAGTALEDGRRVNGPLRFVRATSTRPARVRISRRSRFSWRNRAAAGTHNIQVFWEEPDLLPAIEIRVKSGVRPRTAHDGQHLLRLDGGTSPLEATFSLPDTVTRPYVGAFSEDPAVLLLPASGSQTGALG
jgi:hypothetical protein